MPPKVTSEEAKKVVEDGYDQIAEQYLAWATKNGTPREAMLERMLQALECPIDKAAVLELGCGAGIPTTQILSAKCNKVYANDISKAQLELGKKRFAAENIGANVEYVQSDMLGIQLQPACVDAVVAMYSIIHVPRTELMELLHKIHMWLMPGGVVLCNLAGKAFEGSVEKWLDTEMYWSSWGKNEHTRMFEKAGFQVLHNEVIAETEDGKEVKFQWMLARKAEAQYEDEGAR